MKNTISRKTMFVVLGITESFWCIERLSIFISKAENAAKRLLWDNQRFHTRELLAHSVEVDSVQLHMLLVEQHFCFGWNMSFRLQNVLQLTSCILLWFVDFEVVDKISRETNSGGLQKMWERKLWGRNQVVTVSTGNSFQQGVAKRSIGCSRSVQNQIFFYHFISKQLVPPTFCSFWESRRSCL